VADATGRCVQHLKMPRAICLSNRRAGHFFVRRLWEQQAAMFFPTHESRGTYWRHPFRRPWDVALDGGTGEPKAGARPLHQVGRGLPGGRLSHTVITQFPA
jgi:hypothetical protein